MHLDRVSLLDLRRSTRRAGAGHRRPRARTVLVVLVAAGLLAAGAAVGSAQQDSGPVAEASRQVSSDPRPVRTFPTPQVAVHPDDPLTVVAVAGELRAGGCTLWVSRDGGLTWTSGVNLLPAEFDHCAQRNFGRYVEPVFAADGTLYVVMGGSAIEAGHPNGPVTALLARTDDLGATVETAVIAAPEQVEVTTDDGGSFTTSEQHRYASAAVDPRDPQRVYAGWRRGLAPPATFSFGGLPPSVPTVATSGDGGRNWSEPVDLSSVAEEAGLPEGTSYNVPELAVTPDGTLYAFTRVRPPAPDDGPRPQRSFYMFRSTDGGTSWDARQIYPGAPTIDNPDVAVDPSSGTIHLTWLQRDTDRPAPLIVYAMASTDGGESWNDPVRVPDPDAAENHNQYSPGIATSPDGRVDIAWHDFRNDPFDEPGSFGESGPEEERWADVYLSSSTDDGRTWSADVRVTDRLIDRDLGATFEGAYRGPLGVASARRSAYVVWPDTRAGDAVTEVEDVYVSRVRFDPAAVTAGGGGAPPVSLLVAGIAGAGIALAVGGGVLLALVRGRRPAREPA